MTLIQIEALPSMQNYNFVLHCEQTRKTFVIDPSEFAPVENVLQMHNWTLDAILNTHHHWDHTGGNLELQQKYNCDIFCHKSDLERVPGATCPLEDGQILSLGSHKATVIHIPGHTSGQVAFHFMEKNWLFVGDTLFNYGCGRVMEGTYPQMHQSLQKLKSLPADTLVYCGHEYTLRNLDFFKAHCEPENAPKYENLHREAQKLRDRGSFTVPFVLGEQIGHNPFLTDSIEEFSQWRNLRNAF